MPKASAGLIVVTSIPDKGLVAVLVRRGLFNFEEMKPESRPGIYQVTAHGGLEGNENFKEAMLREVGEELGEKFAINLSCLINCDSEALIEASRLDEIDRQVVTFAIKIDAALLKEIRLAPDSGGLRFISIIEARRDIVDARDFDKATGVRDSETIAMFPDAKAAVIKALQHFSYQ